MATIAAVVFAIPVLLGFIRDWLFTAGHLRANNQLYIRIQYSLYFIMARLLPPLWRLLLALTMALILQAVQPWIRPQAWLELLLSWHVPWPELLASALSISAVIGIIMVLLGFMGRFGAIVLLFPIGFDMATRGLVWFNTIALICALSIAMLGTGPFSLWRPEDSLINHRRGGS